MATDKKYITKNPAKILSGEAPNSSLNLAKYQIYINRKTNCEKDAKNKLNTYDIPGTWHKKCKIQNIQEHIKSTKMVALVISYMLQTQYYNTYIFHS